MVRSAARIVRRSALSSISVAAGIRHQIVDGYCGLLADDVEQAAAQIALLLGDQRMRRNIGRRARERVRRHFLMTRLLEQWLDLIATLTARSRTRSSPQELAALA
jgi:glycosyltransferase involved in cell wall biosynthesis